MTKTELQNRLAHLENACGSYRRALEYYAQGESAIRSDGGERARHVLSLSAGEPLLDRVRELEVSLAEQEELRRTAIREIMREHDEAQPWKEAAERWERSWRRSLYWLKDLHNTNDFNLAAEKYRTELLELLKLRRRFGLSRDIFSALPGLADRTAPHLLEALQSRREQVQEST